MKKLLSGILLMMMSGLCFTACSDDDEERTYSTTPEIASAGVYSGTWTKIQDGGDTTYAQGTLTFEQYKNVTTDPETGEETTVAQPYVTLVTASCNDNGISIDKQSVANISYAEGDYKFFNIMANGSKNGFGVNFSGTISESGVATISYTITEKSGRKTFLYYYSFEGTKQKSE